MILSEECGPAEMTNMVFAGTMITNGYATALVTRTGMETEIGKIQQAVMEAKEEEDKEADYSSMLNGMSLMITQREELLLRSKKELLEFLELSDQYDITLILEKLSGNEFLEEQAVRADGRFNGRSFYQRAEST